MDDFSQSSLSTGFPNLSGISVPLAAFSISLQSGFAVPQPPSGDARQFRRVVCLLIPQAVRHDLQSFSSCLDENDLRDVARYRKHERQMGMAAARIALKAALHELAGRRFEGHAALDKTETGKPLVVHPPGFHASIAHTDQLDAVAVAEGIDVGIDVEASDIAPTEPMLAGFLSKSELTTLEKMGADLRHDLFLKLWTIKEALAKLTGEGLSETASECGISDRGPSFVHVDCTGRRSVVFATRIADLTGGREPGRLALAIDARHLAEVVGLHFSLVLGSGSERACPPSR
ncbi:4'-phosphopantetheinyl transferase family protein [Rhodomicrobium lacus]|uniref:4'-phosphopantetheinyl transferase family protein n=1 Tax=Rhodomicrobium lacus TaxID=2498452 RepID=UPI0026E128BC|nr:4'-phosphopantetheinyl transferase superfamily protein [Rhodomicrobium lacus]WKW49537.1 4'-phosphopantetheinyl transferase superfamily protein [Rhodomicrobium lacus]